MSSTDVLLQQISAFCKRHGMAESTFGLKAVNDGKLVKSLKEGRNGKPVGLTVRKMEQIQEFMRAFPKKSEPARLAS